ncbi:prenyltransferase [Enterococcus saccharolyticus]|uniref:Prenyltransferase n=1 Tax=Candidatus Enterococcus willemsii TaxID=1857215 RepID=A0ABQ6YVU4_9ENTE|nr:MULTISPECIES: prenyltransferase [Enterococcus]KAF1301465.1 prenyltransferase [Enterococcus sp. CU12B]MCD5003115.1 prenyltransferase [Enterococcus saccharolyticus]
MIKRLAIYFKEMYPLIPRFFLAIIYFFEIYFVLLLNVGENSFSIGPQEWVGVWTIFTFLMALRIADDFKDYEHDLRLFPERALPSGRVTKRDLAIALATMVTITVLLNFWWMNNIGWFLFLFAYGTLMSLWFFSKAKIQKSLPLALVTHNPVMMVMNIYIITFVCYKYHLPLISLPTVLLAFTMYFPSLIWEISRKIRAPKDETEYVTYSRLFTYQKATRFVQTLTLVDIVTNFILLWAISKIGVLVLLVNVIWINVQFQRFIADPNQFSIKTKVERYTYITETTMVLSVIAHLISQGLN